MLLRRLAGAARPRRLARQLQAHALEPSAAREADAAAAKRSHRALLGADEQPTASDRRPARQPERRAERETHAGLDALLGARARLPTAMLDRARQDCHALLAAADKSSPPVDGESARQQLRRQQKAVTRHLDKLLWSLRQKRDYVEVEAVAHVWEEAFPQFAGVPRHCKVICEHLALTLNQQKRFREVVDNFWVNQLAHVGDQDAAGAINSVLMSPVLSAAIFVACGHLGESLRALELHNLLQKRDISISKVSYFHLLNSLLKDPDFCDCDRVLQICEELTTVLPGDKVPLSLLPSIIMMATQYGELDRAMSLYAHPRNAPMSSYTEFRLEICAQTLWEHNHGDEMIQLYRGVMNSATASRDVKERLSKGLLRKVVTDATVENRTDRLDMAHEIMEVMNEHSVAASPQVITPLLHALLLSGGEDEIKNAAGLRDFFGLYTKVLEWNAYAVGEAVIMCVHCKRVQMVDDLVVYALDRAIPIKYAALETVVAFYFKLGMMGDLERVADIVRALRLNKHIPLGIAVTEIGMSANIRLGRYEEVIHLFEDFVASDGERKRILNRRFILKSARTAYAVLRRTDEANALQKLLNESYTGLLEEEEEEGDDVGEGWIAGEDHIGEAGVSEILPAVSVETAESPESTRNPSS